MKASTKRRRAKEERRRKRYERLVCERLEAAIMYAPKTIFTDLGTGRTSSNSPNTAQLTRR